MKHLLIASTVVVCLASAACGTDVDLGSRPQYRFGSNNLTMFVYDAQTGAIIPNAAITVQIADATLASQASANAYVVTGIPSGSFPVTITADGYLPVTGTQQFSGQSDITLLNTQQTYVTLTVALYPLQALPNDVTVKAYNSTTGAPINNGVVTAKIDTATTIGSIAGAGAGSAFSGTVGFVPNTVSATIAGGSAVLTKDQLIFGATYDITVTSAQDASGAYLAPGTTTYKAGTDYNPVVVFMGGPAVTPVALSANNEDSTTFESSLIVSFPYPITVCTDSSDWDWTNSAGTSAEPATTNPVTRALTQSNTVLSLTPNIEPATQVAGEALRATFSGISVQVQGGSKCVDLGQVTLRGGTTKVNLTINIE